MLENLEYPAVPVMVKIRPVQTISREVVSDPSETACRAPFGVMIQSVPYGDIGRSAEMTDPSIVHMN